MATPGGAAVDAVAEAADGRVQHQLTAEQQEAKVKADAEQEQVAAAAEAFPVEKRNGDLC